MKHIRKFELPLLILSFLSIGSVHSFVPASAAYAATKTVLQKAWKLVVSYKPLSSKSIFGLELDPVIKLTYQNGGRWITTWAKNPSVYGTFKGLAAKVNGVTVKKIIQSKDLTKSEKNRALNSIKAKEYIYNAGGINVYKSLPKSTQKSYRRKATEHINEMISQSQSNGLFSLKSW